MGKRKRTDPGSQIEKFEGATWTPVDVGDQVLLGSEEYGFMGLEILEPSSVPTQLQTINNDKKVSDDKLACSENLDKNNNKKTTTRREKRPKDSLQHPGRAETECDDILPSKEEDAHQPTDTSAWDPLELHSSVQAALGSIGFSAPTHIQSECIPAAVRDKRDIIGAAQTGSGKTLAFGLPIIHALRCAMDDGGSLTASVEDKDRPLRALIVTPTRELALQVTDHLRVIAQPCGIWVVAIVGGISSLKQERLLSKKPDIVVATPGRLWDLLKENQPHLTRGLDANLEFLVIDEADRMIQQGQRAELASILEKIKGNVMASQSLPSSKDGGGSSSQHDDALIASSQPIIIQGKEGKLQYSRGRDGPQIFIFSATLTLPASLRRRLRKGGGGASGSADLEKLMDSLPFSQKTKPKIVDLMSEKRLADSVTEAVLTCPEQERDEYLYCLLVKHPGRTIIFVNAISSVRRLSALLQHLGLPVRPLHAEMQQRQRLKSLDAFRCNENGILVATDVAARGLDIKDVKCIVHYQIPASLDTYVHRSGRTGRAEAEGLSVALVVPKESPRFLALLKALGKTEGDLPEFPIDGSLIHGARKRVRLAVKLDQLLRKQSKAKAESSWKKKSAEDLGIILSEGEDTLEDDLIRGSRYALKKKMRNKQRAVEDHAETEAMRLKSELAELLAEPLQGSFSKKFFTGGAARALATDSIPALVKGALAMAEKQAKARTRPKQTQKKPPSASKQRAQAVKAAVEKKLFKKKGKAQPVQGRERRGADALSTVRQKLAALQ